MKVIFGEDEVRKLNLWLDEYKEVILKERFEMPPYWDIIGKDILESHRYYLNFRVDCSKSEIFMLPVKEGSL